MSQAFRSPADLEVYQPALRVAMRIFELTTSLPKEETHSLTDQIRRLSRSVCANLVIMIQHPDRWMIKRERSETRS